MECRPVASAAHAYAYSSRRRCSRQGGGGPGRAEGRHGRLSRDLGSWPGALAAVDRYQQLSGSALGAGAAPSSTPPPHLQISPVVMKRCVRRSTSTAADLKTPPAAGAPRCTSGCGAACRTATAGCELCTGNVEQLRGQEVSRWWRCRSRGVWRVGRQATAAAGGRASERKRGLDRRSVIRLVARLHTPPALNWARRELYSGAASSGDALERLASSSARAVPLARLGPPLQRGPRS